MARPLRVEYPGAYYHVINRGNGGEKIFRSIRDREKFSEYLEKTVERFSIIIHTYCLMTNHYHLLIETPEPNLSVAIQWLNVSYAGYFNRKWGRAGHLFQGRFKAILIDADEYLKQLSRYIHLNPVRAGRDKMLEEFIWSSYPAFIGRTKPPDWLETRWLLTQFGRNKNQAMKNYKGFVEGIDIKRLEDPHNDLVGGFILGGTEFVSWVKDKFLSNRDDEKEIPQLKRLKPKVPLERIVQAVCCEVGCSEENVREKGRHRNGARRITIYLARDLSGIPCKELGNYFGGVSGAAVTLIYNQVAGEAARNRRLRTKANKIKKQILNF
jgi:putative transposase